VDEGKAHLTRVARRLTRAHQLDGLRALAASMVVVHHWTDWGQITGISFGNIGVQLFFVLSGFLITRILLCSRNQRETGAIDLGAALASFHLSRIARIWPVFFLTLGLVYAAGDRFERQADMDWHALFASNLLFFQRGAFGGNLSHFWSLAVEQQFYLVWPLLVLLAPRRALEPVILALVVLAPLTRLALYGAGFTDFAQFNLLPFASFDSLGAGALVALWSQWQPAAAAGRWQVLDGAACLAVGALAGLTALGGATANLEQTLYAIVFAALIARASNGIAGPAGRVLAWPPLIALGTISYGVYVYHMFAPRIVGAVLRSVAAPDLMLSGLPLFALSAALTLAAATASWVFMERPVLNWRKGLQAQPAQAGGHTAT